METCRLASRGTIGTNNWMKIHLDISQLPRRHKQAKETLRQPCETKCVPFSGPGSASCWSHCSTPPGLCSGCKLLPTISFQHCPDAAFSSSEPPGVGGFHIPSQPPQYPSHSSPTPFPFPDVVSSVPSDSCARLPVTYLAPSSSCHTLHPSSPATQMSKEKRHLTAPESQPVFECHRKIK